MGLFDNFANRKPEPESNSKSSPTTRKRKEDVIKPLTDSNYTDWEKDLGFLVLIMNRKKNITKNYYINIFSTQLSPTDYIRDEDLEEIISGGVIEVINELSDNYKNYLVNKYFSSEKQLIKFITEEFYVDLTSAAISQNNGKIRDNIIKKKVNEMTNVRNDEEAEKEGKE